MKQEIATLLLDISAVQLKPEQPFTWASGIRSPIYCDNRLLLGYPEARKQVRDGFLQLIQENCPHIDVVAGVATGAIAHAAWVAEALNKPMIYLRQAAKDHGKGNQVEGPLQKGKSVVVLEDLISTGGSSTACITAARAVGAKIQHCLAIFNYGFSEAQEKFDEIGCHLSALTDFATLLGVAKQRKLITADQEKTLQKFTADPWHWLD